MRLSLSAAVLMLLVSAAVTAASDVPGLSLQEAIDAALRQNPNLLASKLEADAARANERSARAPANPEILVTPGIAGEAGSEEELSITQPLELNGQRTARTRVARAERQAAEAGSRSAERDLVRSVKQTYWDVVLCEHLVELSGGNLQLAQALHEAARRQLDAGSAPGAQLIKADVELSRARQELSGAESELMQRKAALNTLLGRPADTPFAAADALTLSLVALDAAGATVSAEERPELAEARWLLDARRAETKVVSARRRPDVAIQARQEKFGGEGGVAVSINIPIVDWGSVRADRERAEAAADAQAQRVEAVRNAMLLDADSALRDVERSRRLIEEYDRGVLGQAEQLCDMAQKGYKAGATGYLEVLEAQRTFRAVRAEYWTALADYRKALAQLEWAAGIDLSATEVSR